jgi:hypothetical protein
MRITTLAFSVSEAIGVLLVFTGLFFSLFSNKFEKDGLVRILGAVGVGIGIAIVAVPVIIWYSIFDGGDEEAVELEDE